MKPLALIKAGRIYPVSCYIIYREMAALPLRPFSPFTNHQYSKATGRAPSAAFPTDMDY